MANRVTFLVDGFNVYHSAKEAQRDLGNAPTLWLNLRSLLSAYLFLFGREAILAEIYYFSALATHLDAGHQSTTSRHRDYIDCLRATGVHIRLGRFKNKTVWCKKCRTKSRCYEEKETDVALSIKLMELFHLDKCDTIVFVTGDTDIAPAVRTATQVFPEKDVRFAFPYKRKNKELASLATGSFLVRKDRYTQHQFNTTVFLPNGRRVTKPDSW